MSGVCTSWRDPTHHHPVVQMLHDLNTYLHKAIPDTKLTIRKYLDVKFEYLVSCGGMCNTESSHVSVPRSTPSMNDLLTSLCPPVVLPKGEGDGRRRIQQYCEFSRFLCTRNDLEVADGKMCRAASPGGFFRSNRPKQ